MRAMLVETREEERQELRYYLLAESCAACGQESYGVRIEDGACRRAEVADITPLQSRVEALLDMLIRHAVTPVALWDVVEDWLAQ